MNLPDLLPGSTVEVLWADMPLWLARRYTPDWGAWWDRTVPPMLQAYHLSPDNYWDLTVADHAQLAAHLGLTPEQADGQQP